jgi:hypothetical protein
MRGCGTGQSRGSFTERPSMKFPLQFMYKCFDVSPPLPSQVQIVFFCAFAFVAALSILANFIVIWLKFYNKSVILKSFSYPQDNPLASSDEEKEDEQICA